MSPVGPIRYPPRYGTLAAEETLAPIQGGQLSRRSARLPVAGHASWLEAFNEHADEAGYLLINTATLGLGGWLLDKFGFTNRVNKESCAFQIGETIDTAIGIATLRPTALLKGSLNRLSRVGSRIGDIALSVRRRGDDLVQWTRHVVSARRLPSRQAARIALPGQQAKAANKFFKGATGKCSDFEVSPLSDGTTRLSFFAPAGNQGYGKQYVQIIDSSGNVIENFKDTLGPTGLIERKWLKKRP